MIGGYNGLNIEKGRAIWPCPWRSGEYWKHLFNIKN